MVKVRQDLLFSARSKREKKSFYYQKEIFLVCSLLEKFDVNSKRLDCYLLMSLKINEFELYYNGLEI